MTSDKASFKPSGLTISYKERGTGSIDEWIHAVLEDMQALKRDFQRQLEHFPIAWNRRL
jgi:hypothetical protein